MTRLYRASKQGFSIAELLVGFALLAVIGGLVTTYFTRQQADYSLLNKKVGLQKLIEDTVIETNGRSLDELPLPGNCRARTYDSVGTFIAEQTASATDSACQDRYPTSMGYKVIVLVSGSSNIQATFSDSDFMKLPHFSNSLLQVQVLGGFRGAESKDRSQLSLTVYKRK